MSFLFARPTGNSGEVEVAIGPTTGPVQILYGIDLAGSPVVWIVGPMLDPGDFALLHFLQNNTTYRIMAFGVQASEVTSTTVVPYVAASPYAITVQHDPVETYVVNGKEAFRLRGRVVSAAAMPTKVFLYRNEQADMLEQVPSRQAFLSVCSPADLEQYPEDAPVEGQEPPFYRLDWIDIVEDRLDDVQYFWESVVSAVAGLKTELEETRIIRDTTLLTVRSGESPEPSLSSISLWPNLSSSLTSSSSSSTNISSSSL